ncbi:MAG TPA: ATP-binding protein, partial [Nitrospiraceae bacterium]|nr:ATP-binding protein [Nitrospiraceae bacterium]
EYCEWEFTWIPESSNRRVWLVGGGLAAAAAFAYVRLVHPAVTVVEAALITFLPSAISWVAFAWLLRKITSLQTLIMEQDQAVDARHEELREVYLEQERTTVELRRRVNQLTTLHRTGLLFSSTLERETLLHNVLETLVHDLQYNRAMIAFYDGARGVLSDMRILGVSDEIADLTRSRELSITNPDSLEGMVLLQGKPVLVSDLQEAWDRMHPLTRQLAVMANVKSMISVPLKINDLILGCMTVDCVHEHALSQEDLDLMMTMATQVAVALDKTEAYRQIETLNLGLETRVRERTAELEAANNQLQQMDRLKSQFLAHVSHELRTPLTSITGFTDNMLEGLAGSLSEKQQQYLTRIKANGSRLARMITNLLDLSRIEAGKLELSLEDIPLAPLISEVVEQIRPIALAKHQRLQLQCEDSDVTAWGDADRLSQILTNLVDNAIKYTQDGGSVMVNVARETASYAKISVTDNGQGIPREALPKLFDPFFRASHHERSQKGLGLGLSIVKELVELHGGAITVRSDEGKGTQFCFTIPLRRGMGKRIPEASQPAKRILVGDDDADIRHLLRDRLESEGYLVHLALDGREALGALWSGSLDGMILDIGIPQIDGLDVLRQVRKKYPAMPVIMITAVEARERAIAAMQAGANAYLLKPFTSAQLQHVVDRYFRPEFERMEGVE